MTNHALSIERLHRYQCACCDHRFTVGDGATIVHHCTRCGAWRAFLVEVEVLYHVRCACGRWWTEEQPVFQGKCPECGEDRTLAPVEEVEVR